MGDHVFLKVMPKREVVRFGKRGKLAPRYIGPFEVLERVGTVAYWLALPPSLSSVHEVLHVSMLRKYTPDPAHVVCDAPNPALSVKRGCHQFFFNKLIAFKLVQSYNVKHLTCTISCSSGLQNLYKLHTWKCSAFTIFTLLHLFTNNKKDITYTK